MNVAREQEHTHTYMHACIHPPSSPATTTNDSDDRLDGYMDQSMICSIKRQGNDPSRDAKMNLYT
jgi:hypothetical protein